LVHYGIEPDDSQEKKIEIFEIQDGDDRQYRHKYRHIFSRFGDIQRQRMARL